MRFPLLLTLALLLAPGPPTRAQEAPIEALPGASEVLDLEACVAEALAANAGLRAQRKGLDLTRALGRQALASALPTLEASGSWIRSRDPSFALDATFGGGGGSPLDSLFGDFSFLPAPEEIPAQSFWRTSLDASWTVHPTRSVHAIGGAHAALERQSNLVREAELATEEATLGAYYDVVRAAEALAAVAAEVRARAQFLEISRRRLEHDLATPLDTLRAAISHANARPDSSRAAQSLRRAGSRLNIVMGRAASRPLTIASRVEIETGTIAEERALEMALRRPSLRALELATEVLERGAAARGADRHPSLNLFASYGYVGSSFSQVGDAGTQAWNLGASMTWPIFDGFLAGGRIDEARAGVERSRAQLDAARQEARLEMVSLLGDLRTARGILRAAELNQTGAERALRETTLRYRENQTDYLQVLNAQSERLRARSYLIQARHEVLTLSAALKRALGIRPSLPLAALEPEERGPASGRTR